MTKQIKVRGHEHTHLIFIESENELGVEYEVVRTTSGSLKCACMAYVFNKQKPKTCKHIRVWQASETMGAVTGRKSVRIAVRTCDQIGAKLETFTFRRAFAFDGRIPTA